jgi:formate dehydrogenase assembly factor FdhD
MAFCPKCKKQFDRATECPDCKAKLVKELPFQTRQSDDGTMWVEIASTPNADEARLIQGFLDAEGIAAQIEDTEAHILPSNIGTLGDVRIYVRAQDEDRAVRLLRHREEMFEKLADDDDTVVTDEGVAEVDENATTEPE